MKHRIEDISHDLTTPDGIIESIRPISDTLSEAIIKIEGISPWFVGFEIDKNLLFFNGKSVFAQLGINIIDQNIELNRSEQKASVHVHIEAYSSIAKEFLQILRPGAWIGKLFARDDRRRVRDPDYITRMFGRTDRKGRPLLSFGGSHRSDSLLLDKIDGRAVAYLPLLNGKISYDAHIFGFLPTLAQATAQQFHARDLLALHQVWVENSPRNVSEGEILIVKTAPLHIQTVFAHVVNNLLPTGYTHTSASILQPNTMASGDIYELYGKAKREITDIPLEFYTLEPYRENIFFSDRDQLQTSLEDQKFITRAMQTAPQNAQAAAFVVKGHQLKDLRSEDWITATPTPFNTSLEHFIEEQPAFPFLRAMEEQTITSQGVLLTRYFPSSLIKRMLISDEVAECLKGIYFQQPSQTHGDFFSKADRALLNDLCLCGIPVFWIDAFSRQVLKYVQKPNRTTGMFVPMNCIDTYLGATVFGVYGSNLIAGQFEDQLHELLQGILDLRAETNHPLLGPSTPLALVTGGGPGAMEIANKTAKELGILSCANIADFRLRKEGIVNEQKQNPYVEAKMTYRLSELVERQAEFNLDFPIFVTGGIGTDFEYCLEEVRRKVGAVYPTPVLLAGEIEYWKEKITSRYQCNLKKGTNKGSEWISGCLFCVQTAKQGLEVYKRFFNGTLPIGKAAKPQPNGFVEHLD